MRIKVKVKPFSKKNNLEMIGESQYLAHISQAPAEGKANKALIELISDYFDVPKYGVKIIAGFKSRNKIIEIEK